MRFCPGGGTLDQLFILTRVFKGVWKTDRNQSACVLWSWRKHSTATINQ